MKPQHGDTIRVPAYSEDIHQTPYERTARVFLVTPPYIHVMDDDGHQSIVVHYPAPDAGTEIQTRY